MAGRNQQRFIYKDFSGGLMLYGDSNFTPVSLNPNQLLKCQNAYWRRGLQVRKGMIKVTSNAISSDNPINSIHRFYRNGVPAQLLASSGGIIALLDEGAGTWSNKKIGMFGQNIFMTSYGPTAKVFIGDGTNIPQEWDGTTMIDYTAAPINTKQFTIHRDRVFSITAGLDIAYSDNLDPTTWSAATITLASGDPTINFMIKHSLSVSDDSVLSQLLLFTDNNVWILTGVDFASLTDIFLHEVDGQTGTTSPNTVVRTPAGIMFLGRQRGRNNVFLVVGEGLNTRVIPIGDPIRQEFGKLADSALDEATAIYFDGYYRLSVRPSGRIQNTKEFWLNVDILKDQAPSWFGPHIRSIGIRSMEVLSGLGDNNLLYGGGENGFLYKMEDGTNDDGVAIDVDILTGFNDYGFPTQEKIINNFFVNIQATGGTVTLKVNKDFQIEDDEISNTLSLTTVSEGFPYTFPMLLSTIATNLNVLNFLDNKIKGIYMALRMIFSDIAETLLLNTIGVSFNVDDDDKKEGE